MNLGTARIVVVSMLIVSVGMLPAASADQAHPCEDVPDVSDAHLAGPYYLVTGVAVDGGPTAGATDANASATGIWEDTNQLDGIQTESGTCRDADGLQVSFDADTKSSTGPVNDAYEGLNQAVNEAYEDTVETVNKAWAFIVDLIDGLF